MVDLDAAPASRPLRREVEPPHTASSVWPLMALVAAAMLTIVSGIAVMARPPRPLPAVAPAADEARREVDVAAGRRDRAPVETMPDHCRGPVYRATPDGRAERYEDCARP